MLTSSGPAREKAEDLVLSAWSAVSPYGVGRDPFGEGVLGGRPAVGALDRERYPGPFEQGGLVPDFSAAEHVGRKGTRTMDRVTALAVTAVGRLLDSCGPELTARPEETALVLGTGSGSVQSIMDFTRDSLVGERPYHVDPARFPNTVMNRAAGQSAIWHTIKGPNTTIAGGRLTGLNALSYAVRLHRGGHCARVLCGAAEEFSVQRAWLEWHGRDEAERETPLGEGCAVFLLEPEADALGAGRRPLVRIAATAFRAFHEQAGAREALAACVRGALARAGARAADVSLVVPLGAGGELAGSEEAGIADALVDALAEGEDSSATASPVTGSRSVTGPGGGSGSGTGPGSGGGPGTDSRAGGPRWLRLRPLLGDTSAAANSLQLAAVAAAADRGLPGPGELALVTGVDRDGMVGCALLGGLNQDVDQDVNQEGRA